MTGGAEVLGRGLAFPPHVGPDGRLAWSEGEVNVREAIEVVLRTDRDERLHLPDFGGGLQSFLFEPNTPATHHRIADRIRRALQAWEPRVLVQSVEVGADPDDPQAAVATVSYALVATRVGERVRLSVPVGGVA